MTEHMREVLETISVVKSWRSCAKTRWLDGQSADGAVRIGAAIS